VNIRKLIREVLEEAVSKFEYQIRDINDPVFYKRKIGEKWMFTTAEDFAENAHNSKIVKWTSEES